MLTVFSEVMTSEVLKDLGLELAPESVLMFSTGFTLRGMEKTTDLAQSANDACLVLT